MLGFHFAIFSFPDYALQLGKFFVKVGLDMVQTGGRNKLIK